MDEAERWRAIRSACWYLRTGASLRLTMGYKLPGTAGEVNAGMRYMMRIAERGGYCECVAEGETAEGRTWEDYRITDEGRVVASAMQGRVDRRAYLRPRR